MKPNQLGQQQEEDLRLHMQHLRLMQQVQKENQHVQQQQAQHHHLLQYYHQLQQQNEALQLTIQQVQSQGEHLLQQNEGQRKKIQYQEGEEKLLRLRNQQLQERDRQQQKNHRQQIEDLLQQLQDEIARNQQAEDEESEADGDDDDDDDEDWENPLRMSAALWSACYNADTVVIRKLIGAGESVDSFDISGCTPIVLALQEGYIDTAVMLQEMGADLSVITKRGTNVLHFAAMGGMECVKWVLRETTINVNSTDTSGWTALMYTLQGNHLLAAKKLVSKGASLFQRDIDGYRAIDSELGPQVLEHVKNLRFDLVKNLLIVAKGCCSKEGTAADDSKAVAVNVVHKPASLISVLGNTDLVRHIAGFFLRKDLITKDPKEVKADAVKIRIEAELRKSVNNGGGNKRARSI
jgi:hypothetical protein